MSPAAQRPSRAAIALMCAALAAAVVVGVLTAPGDDWDLAVIALRPGGSTLAVLAATDTD